MLEIGSIWEIVRLLLVGFEGVIITWEKAVKNPRTQLNDALMESYALRRIFPRESLRTKGRDKRTTTDVV